FRPRLGLGLAVLLGRLAVRLPLLLGGLFDLLPRVRADRRRGRGLLAGGTRVAAVRSGQSVLVLLHGPGGLLPVRSELLQGVDAGRTAGEPWRATDGAAITNDGWCDEEALAAVPAFRARADR